VIFIPFSPSWIIHKKADIAFQRKLFFLSAFFPCGRADVAASAASQPIRGRPLQLHGPPLPLRQPRPVNHPYHRLFTKMPAFILAQEPFFPIAGIFTLRARARMTEPAASAD